MRNVEWEKVTPDEFAELRQTGVCVLPLGCIEVHGPHLPLGTDVLRAHGVAVRAAQREPAIVAPRTAMGFAQVSCGLAGGINMPARMLLKFWENLCGEISRNGFKKILVVNAHGGNSSLLDAFLSDMTSRRRDYALYLCRGLFPRELIAELTEGGIPWGHACGPETATALELFPELVRRDALPDRVYQPRPGIGIEGVSTPIDWCTNWPENYVGDARRATPEIGRRMVEWEVDKVAKLLADIKKDDLTPGLLQAFHDRREAGGEIPKFT